MAAPVMSMNLVIHCAVRRDLGRLARALDDLAEGDVTRAGDLRRAFDYLDGELTRHHEGEHEIAWPAMRELGVDEALLAEFDEEHDAMAGALRETSAAMAALAASPGAEEVALARAAVTRLAEVTTSHLSHEETLTEPLYAEHHEDPVVKQMGKRFSRESPLSVAGPFFAWVQDGASADELAALRQSVPGPVLTVITRVFGRRYRREIAPVWAGAPG